MDTTTVNTNPTEIVDQAITPIVDPPVDLVPLTPDALQHYDAATQAEIMGVASQIDPLKLDKIMAYGSLPLVRSFEFAGKILKAIEGTSVDQEVVKQVAELSKQANKNQSDLNVAIQEPNLLQRFLMNIFTSLKEKRDHDTKVTAISCYRLLTQLKSSCEVWHDMLKENYNLISEAIEDVVTNGILLEKYIVAGRIAEQRIEGEIEERRLLCEQTGFTDDKAMYEAAKEGFEAFKLVLLNLEKSRAAYGINFGQLRLERDTNKKLQLAVMFQKTNSMATAGQQIVAAVFNAQNRQIQEGQRSITALNDELLQQVSSGAVLTAQEAEKLLLNSVYSIEVGLAAAKTVIEGCQAIEKAGVDRNLHIAQELDKLQVLVDELAPFIHSIQEGDTGDPNTKTTPSTSASGKSMTF